jgi:hypothetical protein
MNSLATIAPMLADLTSGGDGMIHKLLMVLIVGICVGIVFLVGRWFIQRPGVPAVAMTIWVGLFILVGAIVIINFLLGLGGHQFVPW